MIFNRYSAYATICLLLCNYSNLTHNQPGESPEGFKQAHAQQHMTQAIPTAQKHAIPADKKASKKPCRCRKKSCWRTRQADRSVKKTSSFKQSIKQFFKGVGTAICFLSLAAIPPMILIAFCLPLAVAWGAGLTISAVIGGTVYEYAQAKPELLATIKRLALICGGIATIAIMSFGLLGIGLSGFAPPSASHNLVTAFGEGILTGPAMFIAA